MHRYRDASLNTVLKLGEGTAQIVAQFAPCPGLAIAVQLFCGIIEICQQISASKHSARQLQDRCHTLLLAIRDSSYTNEVMTKASESAKQTLESVLDRMNKCAKKKGFEAFLHQREIEEDIRECQTEVTSCYEKLQLSSHSEIHNWQTEFKANQQRDHEELVHFLAGIKYGQELIQEKLEAQSDQLTWIMSVMQQSLSSYDLGDTRDGLEKNLYTMQKKIGSLLPEPNLKRGEVRSTDPIPLLRLSVYDLYEGLYLGQQKVWMKQLRVPSASGKHLQRFYREADIWGKLWARDQAEWDQHGTTRRILPFLGFCEDGPGYQYFISPAQTNGTAKEYLNSHPGIDRLKLIKGIAQGLLLLHTMDPPVVHGDLNASTVIIDDWGNPLLSDFGIANVVEDVIGSAAYTQTQGANDAARWWAPELNEERELSTRSDIYSFGMTILEIMTGKPPWYGLRALQAVVKVSKGERPFKEKPAQITNDILWELMVRCWDADSAKRPTIQEVVTTLAGI